MREKIKNETINSRLKSLRKELRITRSFIYNKYGLSQDTLKSWETDKKITNNGLEKCLDIFKNEGLSVSKEWVLTGKGPQPKTFFDINRYLEEVVSDETLHNHEINDDFLVIEEVNFLKSRGKNAIVVMVKNTDMLPFYQPGDYVGGRFDEKTDIWTIIGSNCIIKTKQGHMIKRMIKNELGGINLVTTNPTHGSLNDPVIYNYPVCPRKIAPICWHRKSFK